MSQQFLEEIPQNGTQPVFDLLNVVAAERKEGSGRVCETLGIRPTISILLQEEIYAPINRVFSALMNDVSNVLKECAVKRTITDWPFENFWGCPHEPKHSKLLAYFINPNESHNCGKYLLKELLRFCKKADLVVDCHCVVENENDRVDIRVMRKAQDGENRNGDTNYAIIFENKINGAGDTRGADGTEGQLDTYVVATRRRYKFHENEIHVFYMPLRSDKDPQRKDEMALVEKGVSYSKITFDNEILKWLQSVTAKEAVTQVCGGILDNLNHYRNLISYLINKKKESEMNTRIIEKLKEMESRGETLPSLDDALDAQKAVNELVPALEIYKSLKAIEAEFRKEFQANVETDFHQPEAEAVGLRVPEADVILWFGIDFTDTKWFCCCQQINAETSQHLKIFKPDGNLRGDPDFPYILASKVFKSGSGFEQEYLPQAIVQMVVAKLLEWRELLIQNKK